MRRVWGIEGHNLWAEWCAAAGDCRDRDGIIEVWHFKFMNVPGLESDMPVVVELVVVGTANPV